MVKKTIHGNQSGPHLLLLAGVHGDEFEPMLAALALTDELPALLTQGTVTIVAVANETAYATGNRFGDDNLDLARVCPGNPQGTSTERAAFEVSELIKQVDFLVDMHTGGLALDIYPLAGYMLHADGNILEVQQQLAITSGMPLIWGTDSRPEGRTLSVAQAANVPAIYLEYGGGTGLRNTVVTRYTDAVKRIMGYLKMMSESTPTDEWLFWLEDYRTDSGFLQVRMPAPFSGIFVPSVEIGDQVEANQLFGCVVDPLSGKRHDVVAEQTGLVFLLREHVHVTKGNTLGGVLPITHKKQLVIHGN